MRTILALVLASMMSAAIADDRPRLIVLTDIGGDPDDTQSLIRLLVHANEFEIEALIASASGTPGELKEAVTRTDLIEQIVAAYGKVRDNLAQHAKGFPAANDLREKIVAGNPQRGWNHVGEGHDTPASKRIIAIVDRDDPRPVNITIWGGQTDLAQALWRVQQDRGDSGFREFASRLRVYDISDQDGIASKMRQQFPGLFYILAKAPPGEDKRQGAYRGMYLGGDESLTSREWVDAHVRVDHGPLGALYPTKTWTAPNPHATLKEGDTPSWFYFLSLGLSDPAHPEWGGWGGRFQREGDAGWYRDAEDRVDDDQSARATVWRWRPCFQNEFQARMDWCVKTVDEANHPPLAVVNGDETKQVLRHSARPDETISFDAARSGDPDGDRLSFHWWSYAEAGSYPGDVSLADDTSVTAKLPVPADAAGKSIHVILQVTDDGEPPLTAFRRMVVDVRGSAE